MSCPSHMLMFLALVWCCFDVVILARLKSDSDKNKLTDRENKMALLYPSSNKETKYRVTDAPKLTKTKEHLPKTSLSNNRKQMQIKGTHGRPENPQIVSFQINNKKGRALEEPPWNIYNIELPNSSYSSAFGTTSQAIFVDNQSKTVNNNNPSNVSKEDGETVLSALKGKLETSQTNGNKFECAPCVCSEIIGDATEANCTGKNLTAIPQTLPSNTTILSMSFSPINELNITHLLIYQSLVNVFVTLNSKLSKILNVSQGNYSSGITFFNLSHCAIEHIDDASFRTMSELTVLDFSDNKLQTLTKFMFVGLEKLQSLDVSTNVIKDIENCTFDSLHNLKILRLNGNKALGYSEKHFPPQIFRNMKQLQILIIHGNANKKDNKYPNEALKQLIRLQYLSIDGLNDSIEFEPGVKSLQYLDHLEITDFCKIVNLSENFFNNLPYLKTLIISNCPYLKYIHPGAYCKLGQLQHLELSTLSVYGLNKAFEDLSRLNNSKLRSITFNRLATKNQVCIQMTGHHSKYIKQMEIEMLDLSDNRIALLQNDFIQNLPTTLNMLILRNNKFTSETQSIKALAMLRNLTKLDMSIQNVNDYFDNYKCRENDFGSEYANVEFLYDASEIDKITENYASKMEYGDSIIKEETGNMAIQCSLSNVLQYPEKMAIKRRRFIDIPPKLKTLKAFKFAAFGMQILTHYLFPPNNSLSVIDFSNSFMSTWGCGVLAPRITEANLGYNYCSKIGNGFFQPKNLHERLILKNNFLGLDLASDEKGIKFYHLKKAKSLDISNNLIDRLPRMIFKGLSEVTHLDISNNKLTTLNISFARTTKLEFLDLSNNSLRWIDKDTRNDLDTLASKEGRNLLIDLTSNPLLCTCEGLEIIAWMATTKVIFHNQDNLTCVQGNMKTEPLGDLNLRKQYLQRFCMSISVYIIGSVAAIFVVMVTAVAGLMYRYRWKLRYLHNGAMAAIFGFQPVKVSESECMFDAYFIYTSETREFVLQICLKELEKKRGHKLCVEDRDFLAGTYIVSNIVSAVKNSTKTVAVITPDFFEENYAEYSFKMAVMEELYKKRSVLHLLLYKQVPDDQMSHDELNVMKRNSYTEFPQEEDADDNIMQTFWDLLSQTIGHTGNTIREPTLN